MASLFSPLPLWFYFDGCCHHPLLFGVPFGRITLCCCVLVWLCCSRSIPRPYFPIRAPFDLLPLLPNLFRCIGSALPFLGAGMLGSALPFLGAGLFPPLLLGFFTRRWSSGFFPSRRLFRWCGRVGLLSSRFIVAMRALVPVYFCFRWPCRWARTEVIGG